MYYRVAIQLEPLPRWQWKSTVLTSLDALLRFLRLYSALPQERLRVFSSASREEMNEQLARENKGLKSTSVTAAQFLQERMMGSREGRSEALRRDTREIEQGIATADSREQALSESNQGTHTLEETDMCSLEKRRGELELGAGGDHDMPYRFTLPTSIPQVLAWMKLLAKVQDGELQP
jgi:hypothetical protein